MDGAGWVGKWLALGGWVRAGGWARVSGQVGGWSPVTPQLGVGEDRLVDDPHPQVVHQTLASPLDLLWRFGAVNDRLQCPY